MKCWLVLNYIYQGGTQYPRALTAIERAQELDTRVADPYDARGIVYYNLILLDLVRADRYQIVSPEHLVVDIQPNSDSVALAHLAAEQFQQGQLLPFIGPDVAPKQLEVSSQQVITQTQNQINAISNGVSTLQLEPNDILSFIGYVGGVYPNTAKAETAKGMLSSLERYAAAHPDQFAAGDPFALPSPPH
jgi:hypothetical protein